MKLLTTKINESNLQTFIDIIMSTELGTTYYPTEEFLRKEIMNSSKDDEMFIIASEVAKEDIGVLWFNRHGAFHSFPFLHVIAIKDRFQGQGYGKATMDRFEALCLMGPHGQNIPATKAFLLVNTGNEAAIKMYEGRGYVCVGEVPGLFRKRVNEKIMMKNIRKGMS